MMRRTGGLGTDYLQLLCKKTYIIAEPPDPPTNQIQLSVRGHTRLAPAREAWCSDNRTGNPPDRALGSS
jgi:hypothetical protein